MQIQVEDVGPCKKLLKIELPPEQVDEELEKTYDQINEGVAVPGFRPGHVPRWLLESKFGKQVDSDAKEALVTSSFEEAIKEQELRPIGAPTFDEEIELERGKPLTYGVTIEVHPEFEIEDYGDLVVEKPASKPSKKEVDERIGHVRRRYAKLEDVAKGAPKKQDVVAGSITLREEDGSAYREIPNHQFILGEHALVGMTGDETNAFVKRAKVGETVEQKITLPEQYPDEAKRGAELTLVLQLEGIRRPVLPELDEEWVKGIGFDSLDEFREEIEGALQREKDQESQHKMEEQIDEQLLKKADFDLPEDVIASMAQRNLVRQSLELRQRGMPQEEIEKQLETMKTESQKSAQKAAKLFFILDKVAEKERVFVTEDEVNARVEAMAANYGRSAEQIWRELESNDRLSELRTSMREEKVKALLLEKATVKEAKPAAKPKSKARSTAKKKDE
jgi:trigger factor